jgi:hypothetical protein
MKEQSEKQRERAYHAVDHVGERPCIGSREKGHAEEKQVRNEDNENVPQPKAFDVQPGLVGVQGIHEREPKRRAGIQRMLKGTMFDD